MSQARRIAEVVGLESWPVRLMKPVREWALDFAYGKAGLPRIVNDVSVRVLPRHRSYFCSDYDAPVAAYFRERIRPGDTCISIGANLGMYPLQFAAWSSPNGKVYAFEPNPNTAAALRTHIRMNGLDDRVQVVEQAVSDRNGTATFHFAGVDGMSRLGEANPALAGHTSAIQIVTDTLDNFCVSNRMQPDALMIDVEGFEIAVLTGARKVLARDHPPIAVVEFHPAAWPVAGSSRRDLEALLAEYRLRPIPLSGQKDPFAEYGHVALELEVLIF